MAIGAKLALKSQDSEVEELKEEFVGEEIGIYNASGDLDRIQKIVGVEKDDSLKEGWYVYCLDNKKKVSGTAEWLRRNVKALQDHLKEIYYFIEHNGRKLSAFWWNEGKKGTSPFSFSTRSWNSFDTVGEAREYIDFIKRELNTKGHPDFKKYLSVAEKFQIRQGEIHP